MFVMGSCPSRDGRNSPGKRKRSQTTFLTTIIDQ